MMRSARLASVVAAWVAALTLVIAGCTKEKAAEELQPKDASASMATVPQAAAPVLKASQDDCVGPLVRSGKPRDITFGDWKFQLDGFLLNQLNKDPDEEIVIGVLSDTKENTEENQRNLDQILDFFEREKVQVIVHLGDIASTTPMPDDVEVPSKDEQGNALSSEQKNRLRRRLVNKARRESMKKSYEDIVEMVSLLAETELPVFVISGNRECKTTFNSAMATLAQDFPNVFNMNLIRRANLDDVDIISMPGYHDPEYVHCPWDKCLYYESDTLSLIDLARQADSEVLLISHGPPRQNHRDGIDVVSEGANVGNPALPDAIRKAKIFFGAFGNIQEAGGKAVNLEGTTIIPQDTFVNSLFLNPGPADSMVWTMNDGTDSRGMAGVIHFVGKKASYKVFRIGEEKKAATEPAGEQNKPQP
jgi:Icc-related predicted phosphoesterase